MTNREIKFRAWHEGRKQMYEDPVQETDGPEYTRLNSNIKNGYELDCYTHLMQYTGLKDKNGKDIYEGNIIKPKHRDNLIVIRFGKQSVSHDWQSIGFYGEDIGGDDWPQNCYDGMGEVIGNIYENPELLTNK